MTNTYDTEIAPAEALPDDVIDFGAWSRASAASGCSGVVIVGSTSTRFWGLTTRERIVRISARRELALLDNVPKRAPALLCSARHVFDPGLLDWCAAKVGRIVLDQGAQVMVHADAGRTRTLAAAMEADRDLDATVISEFEQPPPNLFFRELSKVEAPFVVRLSDDTHACAERASFRSAYRGVTDMVTKYAWPVPAFHLTRAASRIGMSPNAVTIIGTLCCICAGVLWWHGAFWAGVAAAFLFMLLDTVDGKLARCTVRSSRVGDLLDHGVDVTCPPLWWLAWAHGAWLAGAPHGLLVTALAITVATYLMQRGVEAAFIGAFGMQIHYWQKFDSRLKLITAQRNTQVPILAIALALSGPAAGLLAIAGWGLICLAIHSGRLWMGFRGRRNAVGVHSWLSPQNSIQQA